MGYGRRTRRSLLSVHLFNAGWFYRLDQFECTFRGFLVNVSSCRFRWAQAPIVNYPGLLTSRHLWIFKREKQIVLVKWWSSDHVLRWLGSLKHSGFTNRSVQWYGVVKRWTYYRSVQSLPLQEVISPIYEIDLRGGTKGESTTERLDLGWLRR
jgi:hypothetical protein